ncbi:protein kinase family protein [Thermomonospora umbrina]|uniref:Serine/threonine protein kinase n=1 Tax=Thermomonospora umbrina TaxID=111806 RepID=A0A3D9STY8_9ACTN|nr:protein kinase family protein [Thermomonospora umbrina]REE99429.1 serine/threonine protein kinase [Thermomonospora umbrina]
MTDDDGALLRLRRARTSADLFGLDPVAATRLYRRLARLVHPDVTGGATTDAFTHLNDLWRDYKAATSTTITTRRHSYRLGGDVIEGDLANLYAATHDGTGEVVVKMPRDPRDGDLIEREAVALRQLPKDGQDGFLPYVPRLVETFRHRDPTTGVTRQANAIVRLDGFHSLAAVHAAYPDGVDPRDAAWMWRRLLVALGFAHRAGVLHGAVLPEHVLIHPERHGLVLVDWCYSVPGCHAAADPSGRVPAMVDRYADWYPPEVPERRPASPATDIHLATRSMTHLMADKAPKAMRLFAKGCTLSAQNRRPDDAWRLLRELDELLERLYGRRRFRPFHMPTAPRKENHHG